MPLTLRNLTSHYRTYQTFKAPSKKKLRRAMRTLKTNSRYRNQFKNEFKNIISGVRNKFSKLRSKVNTIPVNRSKTLNNIHKKEKEYENATKKMFVKVKLFQLAHGTNNNNNSNNNGNSENNNENDNSNKYNKLSEILARPLGKQPSEAELEAELNALAK